MKTGKQVTKAWSNWTGKMHTFTKMLDKKGVAYLSFSKVSTVESCPQRYLLEYVERVKLRQMMLLEISRMCIPFYMKPTRSLGEMWKPPSPTKSTSPQERQGQTRRRTARTPNCDYAEQIGA